MKIALYGGAFNPVHNEHVNIVKAAIQSLGLDKVIVIPTAISPHKKGVMTASPANRLKMCRMAFSSMPAVEVSDFEIKRGGVSYSYVTCRHFAKLFQDDELYFIIGADMLKSFHLWRQPEDILKCVTLAVCARESEPELQSYIKSFNQKFKSEIVNFGYVGKNVSSTKVRTLAALGEDVGEYTPENVRIYIRNKELYALKELWGVRGYLKRERWEHTVRVAITAAENCCAAGVFEIDAITAAALHDCAKYLSPEAAELRGFTLKIDAPEPVVHQFTGAYVAEHTFGIKDENILNAIRYHTTGRENMSSLEKLIYLSDMLEEGRTFDGVETLRNKLKISLDVCLKAALEHQLNYLKSTGKPVHPLTQRAYNYIIEETI